MSIAITIVCLCAPAQRVRHDPVVYRPGRPTRKPATEHPDHPSYPISRLGHEYGEPADHPVSRPQSSHCSGDPEDRSAERAPALAGANDPMSSPLSRTGEGTGGTGCRAGPEDDLYKDLIPRQPDDESARDNDIPAHPLFDNYYVQGYDRTDGTQSAPPLIEREGDQNEGHLAPRAGPKDPFQAPISERETPARQEREREPVPGPESEPTENNKTVFREKSVIAVLTDAPAPQHPSIDVDVRDSGQ